MREKLATDGEHYDFPGAHILLCGQVDEFPHVWGWTTYDSGSGRWYSKCQVCGSVMWQDE